MKIINNTQLTEEKISAIVKKTFNNRKRTGDDGLVFNDNGKNYIATINKIKNKLVCDISKLATIGAILLTATLTLAEEKPFNPHSYTIEVIKPIRSYHFKDRNHPAGLKYNENHLASLGLGVRHDESGFGANVIYVNKNSLDNQAWYIQADNMQEVYRNFYIGGSVGYGTGYPKKAKNRSKTDPVPWVMLQAEYCPTRLCLGFGLVPYEGGALISAIKYKF